jgi:hypothetical protein
MEFAKFTLDEGSAVNKIIDRAKKLGKQYGIKIDHLGLRMDLSATHAQCPLRLTELADADEFNFVHDVFGIMRHMNRSTGVLDKTFCPRFAR